MIWGRIISINEKYYNKIIDTDGYSYFICISPGVNYNYIKVDTANLDKKTYIYNIKIIVSQSNVLTQLIPMNDILEYTPFTKSNNKRKNYYKIAKENKLDDENPYIKVESKSGILNFN